MSAIFFICVGHSQCIESKLSIQKGRQGQKNEMHILVTQLTREVDEKGLNKRLNLVIQKPTNKVCHWVKSCQRSVNIRGAPLCAYSKISLRLSYSYFTVQYSSSQKKRKKKMHEKKRKQKKER
jgi:hypothetical protein